MCCVLPKESKPHQTSTAQETVGIYCIENKLMISSKGGYMFGAIFSLFRHMCPGALDLEFGHGTGQIFWLPRSCFFAEKLPRLILLAPPPKTKFLSLNWPKYSPGVTSLHNSCHNLGLIHGSLHVTYWHQEALQGLCHTAFSSPSSSSASASASASSSSSSSS